MTFFYITKYWLEPHLPFFDSIIHLKMIAFFQCPQSEHMTLNSLPLITVMSLPKLEPKITWWPQSKRGGPRGRW
jgi:hypothetical protein